MYSGFSKLLPRNVVLSILTNRRKRFFLGEFGHWFAYISRHLLQYRNNLPWMPLKRIFVMLAILSYPINANLTRVHSCVDVENIYSRYHIKEHVNVWVALQNNLSPLTSYISQSRISIIYYTIVQKPYQSYYMI